MTAMMQCNCKDADAHSVWQSNVLTAVEIAMKQLGLYVQRQAGDPLLSARSTAPEAVNGEISLNFPVVFLRQDSGRLTINNEAIDCGHPPSDVAIISKNFALAE